MTEVDVKVDVVADGSESGVETLVESKGGEEMKDVEENGAEGDDVRREVSMGGEEDRTRDDVDVVAVANAENEVTHAIEGGKEEREEVGEENGVRREGSVGAKEVTEREDAKMVEAGSVGNEEIATIEGSNVDKMDKEDSVRREENAEVKEVLQTEHVDNVEAGNAGYEELTYAEGVKEDKGDELGTNNNVRREESVETIDVVETELVGMVEAGNGDNEGILLVEGGNEGEEVGKENDVGREDTQDSVKAKEETERDHVDKVEAGNAGNGVEACENVGKESDVTKEEIAEGKEERRREDVNMVVAENAEDAVEGGERDEREEVIEENNSRREEKVEGKEETKRDGVNMMEADNAEDAIEGNVNNVHKMGGDNDARREDNVKGKEERKGEDVDMVEAGTDEEPAVEGGDEDEEEVSGGNSLTDEEESDDGKKKNMTDDQENEDMKRTNESTEADISKKRKAHRQNTKEKQSRKGDTQSESKGQKSPRTPVTSLVVRPARHRKSVERLVEVVEKEPYKEFLVDKGRGVPLKDIPNVSYKLAKKKPGDIKLLHQAIFGRKGKTASFKNHILEFSGFTWNENEEKERAKVKERLDKHVKDTLLDICDLFNIPVSKAPMRKEDLVVKLLNFLVAPHASADATITEKGEQPSKSRKRKSKSEGTASIFNDGIFAKGSKKKRDSNEQTTTGKRKVDGAEEDDETYNTMDNDRPDEGKPYKHSDDDENENDSEETDEQDEEHLKNDEGDTGRSSKQQGSARKEKLGTNFKTSDVTFVRTPSKVPSSTHQKEINDHDVKVFSRKLKNVDVAEKKSISKSDKKNSTGKNISTSKIKQGYGPSKKELRNRICKILKDVDFNETTFTDILTRLATYFKMDLTPRKSTIKIMIQEELTKLADEVVKSVKGKDAGEGTSSKNVGGIVAKVSSKKQDRGEHTTTGKRKRAEEPGDEEDKDNGSDPPSEGVPYKHSDSDENDRELDEQDDEHLKIGKGETSKSSKQLGSAKKDKLGPYHKTPRVTTAKSSSKTPPANHQSEESNDVEVKVFSRKKKNVDAPKKKLSSKPDKKEKPTGKKLSTGRGKAGSVPSKEELRKTICEILKEIDFSTATFSDMLKQLDAYYKMDLKPKKSAIKLIIEEELSKLADAVVETDDDDDDVSEDETIGIPNLRVKG